MADPLSTAASAVSVLEKLRAVPSWFGRQWRHRTSDNLGRLQSGPVEAFPQFLSIDLTRDPPTVEVQFRVTCYSRKEVRLKGFAVTRLAVGGASVDRIPMLQALNLAPLSSFGITCSRALADSEARQLNTSTLQSCIDASVSLEGDGRVGSKEFAFGASSLAVRGCLRRAAV